MNLLFAVGGYRVGGERHHHALQLHDDFADGGDTIDHRASRLDVEVLIAGLTL